MSKHKRKGFDPFDLAMENAELSAGIMIGTGVVGKLGEQIPSSSSSAIMGGMNTMSMLPTLHATGGVFSALKDMEMKAKRRR